MRVVDILCISSKSQWGREKAYVFVRKKLPIGFW